MNNYKDFVSILARDHVDKLFLNSDKEHALVVLVEIFKNAHNTLRIFAGSLCKEVANSPEYVEALSDFIERGGTVRILLNNYDEKLAINSNLFKRLAYYTSEGRDILVRQNPAKPYLKNDPAKKEIHFTVADEVAYRIETDITLRTAECNFNNPAMAKGIVLFFDNLFLQDASVEINLTTLFNLADDGNK